MTIFPKHCLHQVSCGGLELLIKNPDDMQFYDVFEKDTLLQEAIDHIQGK